MHKIDVEKYLNNACIIQSYITNNNFVPLNLNNDIIDLFKFHKKNRSIDNFNDLAKKYISIQPKYNKKNKIVKTAACQAIKNLLNSVQYKNLATLLDR